MGISMIGVQRSDSYDIAFLRLWERCIKDGSTHVIEHEIYGPTRDAIKRVLGLVVDNLVDHASG